MGKSHEPTTRIVMECGCTAHGAWMVTSEAGTITYPPTIEYCNEHAAAPDLLAGNKRLRAALESALHYIEIGQYNATNEQVYINEIRAALAKGDTDE